MPVYPGALRAARNPFLAPMLRPTEQISLPCVSVCMRICKASPCIVLFALAFTISAHRPNPVASTTREATSVTPLWGDLAPGPYRVGFSRLFRFDASRTWQRTRDFKGTFSPDLNGRPVQINVWYPAAVIAAARQMRFADYVDQTAPEAFSKFSAIVKDHNRRGAVDS